MKHIIPLLFTAVFCLVSIATANDIIDLKNENLTPYGRFLGAYFNILSSTLDQNSYIDKCVKRINKQKKLLERQPDNQTAKDLIKAYSLAGLILSDYYGIGNKYRPEFLEAIRRPAGLYSLTRNIYGEFYETGGLFQKHLKHKNAFKSDKDDSDIKIEFEQFPMFEHRALFFLYQYHQDKDSDELGTYKLVFYALCYPEKSSDAPSEPHAFQCMHNGTAFLVRTSDDGIELSKLNAQMHKFLEEHGVSLANHMYVKDEGFDYRNKTSFKNTINVY